MERLMIVEDKEEISRQLAWGLCGEYELFPAANRQEALSVFKKHRPPVVTLDLGLPPDENGTDEGFKCLEEILKISPRTKVIVITGRHEKEHAGRAVMNGAYDFFDKPIDLHELKVILKRAYNLAMIEREEVMLQAELVRSANNPGEMIGQSPRMQQVFTTIRKVAASDVTVLVTGESGTGKELVAKAIHGLSPRRNGPCIAINCGAIPDHLLESELFGHEKGAFSGAHNRVQGKFEFSNRGTLFLDEVGELPLPLQVKLLRFLQEKTMQRVGGREDLAVDARIVAATNRDITAEASEGRFREDLYYRLSVIQINLPPLRERHGDIMLLANHFLQRYCDEFGKKERRFSADAIKLLECHSWPGNVRELENMIQRAVIMSETSLLQAEDLGLGNGSISSSRLHGGAITLRDAREKAEKDMILAAIVRNRNNMAKAAQALGISRPTLYDLARKHGIERFAEKEEC